MFTTVTPICIPIENERTDAAEATCWGATTISSCCVPAPPGVAGTSVDMPLATTTSPAIGFVPALPHPLPLSRAGGLWLGHDRFAPEPSSIP